NLPVGALLPSNRRRSPPVAASLKRPAERVALRYCNFFDFRSAPVSAPRAEHEYQFISVSLHRSVSIKKRGLADLGPVPRRKKRIGDQVLGHQLRAASTTWQRPVPRVAVPLGKVAPHLVQQRHIGGHALALNARSEEHTSE